MAVVIRLQGLRVTAGAEDIRRFFTGLKIPDGGVHIIGGEREEAFIIFASDEDARRAMTRSGGLIKGSPVTLLLSSKTEMQSMLERTTKIVELDQKRRLEDDVRHPRRSMDPEMGRRSGSRSGDTPPPLLQRASNTDDVFLFLKGLPFSVTEKEICDFFSGILVEEVVLVKNRKGSNNGTGFVKFATRQDAMEGLKRDREYIGSRYIEISTTTLNDWYRATGGVQTARNPQHRVRSRSPVAQRHIAPSDEEYCVVLENLSFAVEKEDIKQLFHNAKLEDDQILPSSYSSDPYDSEKICIFVRNLPFDVRKVEIIDFFHGFNITEDNTISDDDKLVIRNL
uniref:RNA binding motif protein 12Bb n=1 Tax=Amphilophus citrinellus TaxID=61819 RepID=A0A3Q0S304_AMPCI